jgi:general stress protein 26
MTDELAQDKVLEIMRSERFCMLTSVGEQGRLHSHPMTPQQVTDDGEVWFFIDTASDHAAAIRAEKRVNLAFADSSTWLSVAGHGTVREDRDKVDALWNSAVEAWFPEGKDAPNVGLLLVEPDSAEYWDSPGGRVGSVLAYAKSKVTGDRPDVGESQATEL